MTDSPGYVLVLARSDERAFTFPGEALEALASAEDNGWTADKLAAGWRYTIVQIGRA